MDIEMVIQLIAIILGSNWVGTMLMEVYRHKKKKKTPAEIILKSLSRSHLLQCAAKYKAQGYIDAEEYDGIFEEYHAYVDLDGNGRVKREYEEGGEIRNLPVH